MVCWRNYIKVGEIVNKRREDSDTEVEKDIVWDLEKNVGLFSWDLFSLLGSILVSGWFHVIDGLVNHINVLNIVFILNYELFNSL